MSLGIYIQVPFCQTKCTYCNFHTGVVAKERYQPYADAVCREIRGSGGDLGGNFAGLIVDTIYVGGGTPSLLEPAALQKMLSTLRENYRVKGGVAMEGDEAPQGLKPASLSDGYGTVETVPLRGQVAVETVPLRDYGAVGTVPLAGYGRDETVRLRGTARDVGGPEVTLEADPETITRGKAAAWLDAGFNRISMGVQSFHDNELKVAGRMHRRADIFGATEALRAAGFRNISMDLIAGLAHQTRESWESSVSELLAIRPEHVSIYLLEVDEGSRLGEESLAGGTRYSAAAIPSDDEQAEFYESACDRLAAAGYEHYEISNWGLPGRRSRHNLKYWRREPYVGFGAGAHSFDGRTRWANVHDSLRYAEMIAKGMSPREQIEDVTPEQAFDEEFFLGLRQLEGVDLEEIFRRVNQSGELAGRAASLRERVEKLRMDGLVETDGARLRLAPGRLTVSNEVFVELLGA